MSLFNDYSMPGATNFMCARNTNQEEEKGGGKLFSEIF